MNIYKIIFKDKNIDPIYIDATNMDVMSGDRGFINFYDYNDKNESYIDIAYYNKDDIHAIIHCPDKVKTSI